MSVRLDYPSFAQRRLTQRRRAEGRPRPSPGRRAPAKPYLTGAAAVPRPVHQAASEGSLTPPVPVERLAPRATPATRVPDDQASEAPSPFLRHELVRLRHEQQDRPRRRRVPLRPRSRKHMIALAVPLILLTAIAVVVGPVVYRGTRAYQEVFVDPVPREEPPPVAVRNVDGTAVIVTTTAVAEIPEWNGTDRLTMLLLGVDRREDEPSRSDTMILVNIDHVAKR
jgi:hypothetical protein